MDQHWVAVVNEKKNNAKRLFGTTPLTGEKVRRD
jgi:hypothetical protein